MGIGLGACLNFLFLGCSVSTTPFTSLNYSNPLLLNSLHNIRTQAYWFYNYATLAGGSCNRPVAQCVLANALCCTLLFQAFWGLLAVHFVDLTYSPHALSSTRSPRALSLAEFFDLNRPLTRALSVIGALCLIGVFVSDVIGLHLLYSQSELLVCEDKVQSSASVNFWSSFCIVVAAFLWTLHHLCCTRR